MPSPSLHPRQLHPRWLPLLLLASPAAIFVLPFFVPVTPAFSESFLFGFSNRLGLLLFVILLAGLALLSWFGTLHLSHLPGATISTATNTPSRRALSITLLLSAGISIPFFLLIPAGNGVSESIYFLDRIGLLSQGLRPYRDFEFVYGPLQLFLPFLTARSLHLSLTDGYYLVWLVSTLLGLLALWISVRWLDLPSRGKPATFLLLAVILGSEILSTGLNYNPLRYAAPIACLLLVHRLSRFPHQPTLSITLQTLAASILSAVLLLGLSPETGITFSIAVLLFFPLRRRILHQPCAAFALSLAASFVAILLAAARIGVFATLKDFSAGGLSLPILPGPHILLFFAAFAIVVVYLTTPDHRHRLLSDAALLALYSLGMLPAALGRCDWAHITGYELGIFLSALLLLAPSPRARLVSQTALALTFLLMFLPGAIGTVGMIVKVQLYRILSKGDPSTALGRQLVDRTGRSLRQTFGPAEAASKLDRIRAVARLPSSDPHVLFTAASPVLYAPFGYSPERLGNVQSPAIAEGRFMGTLNILRPVEVAEKIAEMQAHPERDLLLAPDGLEQCGPFRGNPAVLRVLFLLPVAPRPRHESDLNAPICHFIHLHYRVLTPASPATGNYALWRSTPSPPHP